MIQYLQKLSSLLTARNKISLVSLLFLTILLSIIETVGISAIMPFISMASNPNLMESGYYKEIFEIFGFKEKKMFIIAFGLALIVFYLFRAFFNIYYSYLLNKFSFGSYHEFASKLFKGYVELPYREFINRNTSTLTKTIVSEAYNLTLMIQNSLILMSEFFTVIFLYFILVLMSWKMTLLLSFILGLKIILLTRAISKISKIQGAKRALVQEDYYRIISETFGNFKMIKLIGNEKNIFDTFNKASYGFSKANIIHATISIVPRSALETIGFSVLISIVIYTLYAHENAEYIIPLISMYALALYRMLPAINRMMYSYNSILFLHKALDIVHADLTYSTEIEGKEKISFFTKIELYGLDFSYDGKKILFKNIDLVINKGEKIAIIGESGSGKSTLVDILIGVYKPCKGVVRIDGHDLTSRNIKSWRAKIGYIPQSVYLFDGTVGENVAFGNKMDELKIINALRQANLWDYLITKNGINTIVGENGIQLSGGQKQRIGIARALYSNPEVLVLDEATSSLDIETETKIMEEIYNISADKTLIIVAHRVSTIEKCQKIYTVLNGKIVNG